MNNISILERIYRFLDSKINEINNLKYIPTYNRVLQDSGVEKFDPHYIIFWFKSRYEKEEIRFESLIKLKLEAGSIKNAKMIEFLNKMRKKIEKLEFLPTIDNLLQERPDFAEIEGLTNEEISKITYDWLKQNGTSLSELKDQAKLGLYYNQLKKILDPRIMDIKNHVFIPTAENINIITDEFVNLNYLTDYISRWLCANRIANNLTEYLYDVGIMSDGRCLKDFLDSKYLEIKNGNYYPTIKNLRKETDQIGIDIDSYINLNKIRYEWFIERIGKSMTQLIEEFEPTYQQLGVELTSHGYPPKFKSQKFRISNALFQTVMIMGQNNLIIIDPPKTFSSFQSFFNYLKKYYQWNFVDILTGEVFTLQDYLNGEIGLHHINFKKVDIRPDNLVFLFKDYHNFITSSKQHFIQLFDFFTRILQKNIKSLKQNTIPTSWKVRWRELASQEGIILPIKRYKSTKKRSNIIKISSKYKKLDSFSNSFDF